MKRTGNKTKGFTLLEILIVLVILAVVAGLAIPAYISAVEKSRKQEAIASLSAIRDAEQRFFAINNTYSATYAGLDFDPTAAVVGNTPNFAYAAPVVAGQAYTVTATRNANNFSVTSGCAAGYTVQINQLGVITSTC